MKATWQIVVSAALLLAAFSLPVGAQPGTGDSPDAKQAAGAVVHIDNFSFTPGTMTVPVGTEVTWINRDDIPHNVVSDNKAFKSKVLDTDEKFTYTFATPGTYSYFCSIHPKMTAQVVVQPKP